MKKTIAFLLVLCLSFSVCACGRNADFADQEMNVEETQPVPAGLTDAHMKAVRNSAGVHAFADYGYNFDSVTYSSFDDDGTYVTICGTVTFKDKANGRYSGNYTIVLVHTDDPEHPYKVASWDLPDLEAEIDPSRDYLAELCHYIVANGGYDSKEKRSYIEECVVANEYYYLFAENGELSFWDFATHETSSSKFTYSFACDFYKGGITAFKLLYSKHQIYNGYPTDVRTAQISGSIKDGKVTISSQECTNCKAEDYIESILDSYGDYTTFVESIMRKAGINISMEQMLA